MFSLEIIDIKGTDEVPNIILNPRNNTFEFSGNYKSENVEAFSNMISEWFDEYSSQPNALSHFIFKINLMDTENTKLIQDIISKIEHMYKKGNNVMVSWYYKNNDDLNKSLADKYNSTFNVPFEKICLN